MDKIQTLDLIENAKKAHELKMHKLELLLDGKNVDDLVSVTKTECDFGKILYPNEKFLRDVLGSLFYEYLDTLHEKWHDEYNKVYEIFKEYYTNRAEKKSFFSKFVGNKKEIGVDIDKANLHYDKLKSITVELISRIEVCKRRVNALNDSKFEEIIKS